VLSRTSSAKFQNCHAPNLPSRTLQGLAKWKKIFKNFQGLSRKSGHPVNNDTVPYRGWHAATRACERSGKWSGAGGKWGERE